MNQNMKNNREAFKALVTHIIDNGLMITLHNEEEDNVLVDSVSVDNVMNESLATDMEWINITDGEKALGTLSLIWGNDPWELISDYTSNEFCDDLWEWFEETMYKRYRR